ncbi:MAG: ABC transporter permease subunit [Candidatus Paceibacterota bacterium]
MTTSGILLEDIVSSLGRVMAGLISGSLLGIVVGLLTGRIKIFSHLFSPLIQVLRSFPPVAIIPLIIIWFGLGDGAKIFSIAFGVFFPVWLNTHIGATRIPKAFLWSAKILTSSKIKLIQKVILPATLPYIIAGIRIGIASAFIMVFVSELTGASNGLGYRISISHLSYRIDEMIASLFVLGGLGAMTDWAFASLKNKIFPWLNFSLS